MSIRQTAACAVAGLMVFQVLSDPRATGSFAQAASPAHVVIAVEENRDFSRIIGSRAAPFIGSLAADSRAALFTQSYALTHPSQPNYLMLFSGSDQGVKNDRTPSASIASLPVPEPLCAILTGEFLPGDRHGN